MDCYIWDALDLRRIRMDKTVYNGVTFKEIADAKVAVFLDVTGVAWEYRQEFFLLPNGIEHIPTFWLPEMQMFLEVSEKTFTSLELECLKYLAASLSPERCFGVLKFNGLPKYDQVYGYFNTEKGVIEDRYYLITNKSKKYPINPPRFYMERIGNTIFPHRLSRKEFDDQVRESNRLFKKGIASAKSYKF
ncbi:MAG: hypothetical protein WC180_03135 [Candidatus Paceibacterota bacterium]